MQTHAWLEGLLPDADGERRWIGVDPTNRGRAGATHVKIGHGRDYQDVPPIRGVYRGEAEAELSAGVEMRRLDAGDGVEARAARLVDLVEGLVELVDAERALDPGRDRAVGVDRRTATARSAG